LFRSVRLEPLLSRSGSRSLFRRDVAFEKRHGRQGH
jgi:hypothetical protein